MSNVTVAELTATNLVIVAGKGGVGKTTVTAVVARAAANAGRRVLVVDLDGKSTLDELLPDLEVQHLSAAELLEEYLYEHGFKRIAKRLASTGVIDVIGTAAPGIDDLVVLGKIKQLERSAKWDLIVVDGPAAGHAITFLTAAPGLLDAVRSGPVRDQATDVQSLLADPDRCQVVLVTLPETTPINELVELSYAIEERVGVRLAPIVVNQVDPATDLPDPGEVDFGRARVQVDDAIAAAVYRRERVATQQAELTRLRASLPIDQLHLAARPTADITPDDIDALAAELTP